MQTKAPLDRRYKTGYTVFVSVSDGKDDDGMPETSSQIDTTTRVTINVTTTTRSRGSGGGGGRRRPQPQPRYPNANTKPNAYGDTDANRTAVLRRDCRGAQRDRNGGSRGHYPGP